MLFNKIEFAYFFGIVYVLYWFVFSKNLKQQNAVVLIASFFFFACFDWRFLFLLFFTIVLDFFIAHKIHNSQWHKKRWLWASISINLSFLGIFKYYNFFIENVAKIGNHFGWNHQEWALKIILPVGISFYTFHGLSYVIDVYNGKIKPVDNFVNYSLFVSFFPLLVAGPIERATHLLPQIQTKRNFDYAKSVDGLRQILWGLVKKIVIADNCAVYVNSIFEAPNQYSGSSLFVGCLLFSFQIYGDFSGYSDIALGTARMLGFELFQNFSFPYFSKSSSEFWKRWHISLSSWFRDYVYIPLGGSRGSKFQSIRNVLIVFLLSGFWHGANFTFLFWGFLHVLFFLPSFVSADKQTRILEVNTNSAISTMTDFLKMTSTFLMVSFAWIFFRSSSISVAFHYVDTLFSASLFQFPEVVPKTVIGYLLLFICIEWMGRNDLYAIEKLGLQWNKALRLGFYYLLTYLILYYYGADFQFLYFQF